MGLAGGLLGGHGSQHQQSNYGYSSGGQGSSGGGYSGEAPPAQYQPPGQHGSTSTSSQYGPTSGQYHPPGQQQSQQQHQQQQYDNHSQPSYGGSAPYSPQSSGQYGQQQQNFPPPHSRASNRASNPDMASNTISTVSTATTARRHRARTRRTASSPRIIPSKETTSHTANRINHTRSLGSRAVSTPSPRLHRWARTLAAKPAPLNIHRHLQAAASQSSKAAMVMAALRRSRVGTVIRADSTVAMGRPRLQGGAEREEWL